MTVTIITDNGLREELTAQANPDDPSFSWISDPGTMLQTDVCIDLLYSGNAARIKDLDKRTKNLVIVNAVETLRSELPQRFIRINAWPTLLKKEFIETVCNEKEAVLLQGVFSSFGKKIEVVPDTRGLIVPRVLSMIINEAYFALEEKVSSKEQIDTAMKLGTNYPYGPFEWSQKIGLIKVLSLLQTMASEDPRYTPSDLLVKEAAAL